MRKFYTIVGAVLLSASLWAQAPQKFSYQAIVRNASSTLAVNQKVGTRISILQTSATGVVVYAERHEPTSNENGLITLEIGGGTVIFGDFTKIDWAKGPFYVRTETDPTGGTDYTIYGESQLLSVPYALFAANTTPGVPGPAGKDGVDGKNGIDGAVGPQGTIGLTGPAGKDGVDGKNGIDGAVGPQGTIGLTGLAGKDGVDGKNGIDGAVGPQGTIGLTGPAGKDGVDGKNGIDGAVGAQGTTGLTGPAGKDGLDGKNGIDGAVGAQGTTGLTGPAGKDGVDGKNGIDGAVGPQGTIGLTGPAGKDGVDGKNGLDGAVGPQGPIGLTGPKGDTPQIKVIVSLTGDTLKFENGNYVIIPGLSAANPTIKKNIVTDIDGNNYKFVVIGNQTWMSENLKTTKYNDGTNIPNVTDNTLWSNLSSGAWSYYNNDIENNNIYGKLYNGHVTNSSTNGNKNVCPTGWHVPSVMEWTILSNYLGGSDIAGSKLKEAGTSHWASPNTDANNESNFTALPNGTKYPDSQFNDFGTWATLWSNNGANYMDLNCTNGNFVLRSNNVQFGFAIRCIKD